MEIQLKLVIKTDDGQKRHIENISKLQRDELLPQTLGLTLAESKDILEKIQGIVVTEQVKEQLLKKRPCPVCSKLRPNKGQHDLIVRTVFGKITIKSPRWYGCQCESSSRKSYSPLA